MSSYNKVLLIGHLGKEPEMKFLPSGAAVVNFSIACNSKSKDGQEHTDWFDVVAWSKTAELCNQYLVKGSKVFIDGRLSSRSWEKDGVKHYKTEVVANQVVFLDKKGEVPETSTTEEAPF